MASWSELDEALAEGRAADALRLAVPLWRETRSPKLADLIDALAAFVKSDPKTAPAAAPADPVQLDAWLWRMDDFGHQLFEGDWWMRGDWEPDLLLLYGTYAEADDPRAATAIADFLLDRAFHRNLVDAGRPLLARLVTLGDERVRARLLAFKADRASDTELIENAALELNDAPPLPEEAAAIALRGLARYRDAPNALIAAILEPNRELDDGTEQVAADALTEMGHPYGEAIALEYDQAAGIISAAGKARLTRLLVLHERRWIGRALFRSTKDRVYRGGLLDEITLFPQWKTGALDDPRLARLRVIRAGFGRWEHEEARLLRASPWLAHLEELEIPSFEMLAAMTDASFPKLRRLRLGVLRPTSHNPSWNNWAQAITAWLPRLPGLRELVFGSIPEDGLEILIEAITAEALETRIETFSIDGAARSWVPRGTRDPMRWFGLLERQEERFRRAAVYYTDAAMTVEWTEEGVVVTLETSEGGDAFELLAHIPARPIPRIVFRDFPGRRAKKLGKLGKLRRELDRLAAADVEMPVRWRNALDGLPEPTRKA